MPNTTGCLDAAETSRVRDWLASGAAGMAWLTGHPGSGMSTLVRDLTAGMEVVWLTPSTMRSRAFMRDVCSNPTAVNGKRKVLVLDELEPILSNEVAVADVAHIVKANSCVPIVCVLQATRAALSAPLRKKAALVADFPRPPHEAMVATVTRVAAQLGLDAAPIDGLCRQAPGDVRHVLETLRAAVCTTRTLTMLTADAVAEVLAGPRDFHAGMTAFLADTGGVPAGIFETYWHTTPDVSRCLAYLDLASAADLVDAHIHGRHAWDLLEPYGALAVGGAMTLPRCHGVRLAKYGTDWNKACMQSTKAKLVRGVRDRRAAAGMGDLSVMDLALVRGMVQRRLDRPEEAAEVLSGAGLGATEALHVMRLWGSGYKLSTHAKIKKLLAPAG